MPSIPDAQESDHELRPPPRADFGPRAMPRTIGSDRAEDSWRAPHLAPIDVMFTTEQRLDQELTDAAGDAEPLADRMAWLVRLRWGAIGTVLVVVALAAVLEVVAALPQLLATVGMLALGNVVFWRWSRSLPDTGPRAEAENLVVFQVLFDLAMLMTLLHFSGGADNPFVMLSVFHMAIAGLLLPLHKAMIIGLGAGLMHGALVLAEAVALLPHHPLRLAGHAEAEVTLGGPLWQSPLFMLGYLVSFGVTEIGVIYFVHNLVRRIREAEARRRAHERVAQSRERLARIGGLAAGVAHTIRNPLHGVMNCVDILQAQLPPDDKGTAEVLELMSEGVAKIENVTSRLLVLTREGPAQRVATDLRVLVQDALQFANMRARARKVPVEVEAGEVAPVDVDPERLTEALANIIDNAIDACREGDRVTIRVEELHDPAGVRIEVEDTGEGIGADDLGKVFDPFFTTKPIGEGTGLGLAITRQVVEDHEGEVSVTSQPGGGTTVRIDLPRAGERTA
jgi:signal transduction histidine kinase